MSSATRTERKPRALDTTFGKERWETRTAAMVREHNATSPASQPQDPERLPASGFLIRLRAVGSLSGLERPLWKRSPDRDGSRIAKREEIAIGRSLLQGFSVSFRLVFSGRQDAR